MQPRMSAAQRKANRIFFRINSASFLLFSLLFAYLLFALAATVPQVAIAAGTGIASALMAWTLLRAARWYAA